MEPKKLKRKDKDKRRTTQPSEGTSTSSREARALARDKVRTEARDKNRSKLREAQGSRNLHSISEAQGSRNLHSIQDDISLDEANLATLFGNLTVSDEIVNMDQEEAKVKATELNLKWGAIKLNLDSHMESVEELMNTDASARAVLEEKLILEQWLADLELICDEYPTPLAAIPPLDPLFATSKQNLTACIVLGVRVKAKIGGCEYYLADNGAPPAVAAGAADPDNYDSRQLDKITVEGFEGESADYLKWKGATVDLLAGRMTDPIRVKRIVGALSGPAAIYVGKHGDHLKTSELLWAYLDRRYCNNWQINLEVVNDLVNLIKTPLTSVGALLQMPDKFNGLVNTIKTRNLDMEQLLQTMMFTLMPLDMRNEIVNKARIFYPQNQAFTWTEVSTQIFNVVSDYSQKCGQQDPVDTITFGKVCVVGATAPKPRQRRRQNTGVNVPKRGNLKLHLLQDPKTKPQSCIFCGGDHYFDKCTTTSLQTRKEKLFNLHRCPICLFDHNTYNLYKHDCSNVLVKCSCGCSKPSHLCPKSYTA